MIQTGLTGCLDDIFWTLNSACPLLITLALRRILLSVYTVISFTHKLIGVVIHMAIFPERVIAEEVSFKSNTINSFMHMT